MLVQISTVTVVIPAFNAEHTLSETLSSLVAQTHAPFDVVVVDDGSTDRTYDVAASFMTRLAGLKIIRIANSGVSRARNTGIEASGGDLVATLDADDLWHPTYLEKMEAALDANPGCNMVYCYHRKTDAAGRIVDRTFAHAVNGWGFYQLLCRNYFGNGSNAVYRRAALEAVGMFETRLVGSEDFYLQLLLSWDAPVVNVPEYLVGYRDLPNSLSKRWLEMAEADKVMVRLLRERLQPIDAVAWRHTLASRTYKQVETMRRTGRSRLARLPLIAFCMVADPDRYVQNYLRYGRRARGPGTEFTDPARGQHFLEVDPRLAPTLVLSDRWQRRLAIARARDAAHGERRAGARVPTSAAKPEALTQAT